MKILRYIEAMRLRTLPLSVSGVMLGIMLAAADYVVRPAVAVFTVLTTVFLQILSNVSNELGDYMHSNDTQPGRQGPRYSLSAGLLNPRDFRLMIALYVLLSAASGMAMIWFSFGTFLALEPVLLLMLGAAAISSAMRYTLGRNPYGYKGWGDLSVFIFFGIVAVLGAYFVASHEIRSWIMLLPAASAGFFSVGVLNVNNIRDMESDAHVRNTVPLLLGERNAKIYHTFLITAGWACMAIYSMMRMFDWWHFLFVLTLPLFVRHLIYVWRHSGRELDRALPQLVISTFLFCLAAGTGFVVYLF